MTAAIHNGATQVLLLNTDAQISRRGIQTLGEALYQLDVSVCGPDYRGVCKDPNFPLLNSPKINRSRSQIPWTHRVPGFCMMVRVEDAISDYYQIYPDEEMRWWYSDDDIEWQAREARGTALIPGVEVRHPPAGGTLLDETLGRWAQEDLAKFVAKWGSEPCLPAT